MRRYRTRSVAFFVVYGLLLSVFGVLLGLAACGTSANNVDLCDQIEEARCVRAGVLAQAGMGCGINFEAPFASSTAGTPSNVAACTRFYKTACLHGTLTPYTSSTFAGCLNEIKDGSCAVVLDPLEAGNCIWLADAGPDADAVAPATDSSTPTDVVTVDVLDAGSDVDACPLLGCTQP